MNFAGAGEFRAVGRHQRAMLQQRAGLTGADRVLDIGSGIGRLAVALAEIYPDMTYRGFDPVELGVAWSRKALQGYSGFEVLRVRVANSFYAPTGGIRAEEFEFPYPPGSKDLAVALSVFTHLGAAAARQYFSQAIQCLAPGGRLYLTTFLLRDGAVQPAAAFEFHALGEGTYVASADEPDLAVAFEQSFWAGLAQEHGVQLDQVFPGTWADGSVGDDFQDALLFVKPG